MLTDYKAFYDSKIVKFVTEVGFAKAAELSGKTEKEVRTAISLLRCRHDPEFFSGELLKIRDKNAKLVPLTYNRGQRKLRDAIDRQIREGKPVRIKLPKARQFGGSTFVQGEYFGDSFFGKHLQFMTVCHDLDSAKNMRSMVDRFYDNIEKPYRPVLKRKSDKWWRFPDRDIDYLIDTADEVDTGRSFTIHRLHASEVAFYRDPATLMTALLQAVPDSPNTMIIAESTANGMGGWWYDFITGQNEFEQVFVAWYEIETYTRPFDSDQQMLELERKMDGADKNLLDQGVTLEQLNWKRYTLENKLNGDEDKFRQEYPATVDESFLTSGRPYFPVTLVRENLIKSEKIPICVGSLEWESYGEGVRLVEERDGWWKFFHEPKVGWEFRYVTGTDPSEGKAVDGSNKDPDFTSITVWDRYTEEDAARFTARVDEDVIADEIYKAGVYFGSACDCVERSSSGIAVLNILKNKDNVFLYVRELQAKTEDKETVEYGFQTNTATRDMLLADLKTRIRLKHYKSNDKDFWKECSTFVYDEKGKPQGQRGTHDDRVFSAALALQASLQAAETSPIVPAQEREVVEPDVDMPRKHDAFVPYVEF